MQLTLGEGTTPEEAADAFFDQEGIERLGARSRTVNGLRAVAGDVQGDVPSRGPWTVRSCS